MCKTPCIGTPLEMGKISVAGFRDRLSVSFWAYGKLVGTHDKAIKIIAPTYDKKKNAVCSLLMVSVSFMIWD